MVCYFSRPLQLFFGRFSTVLWRSLDSMVFPLLTLVVRVVFVSSALMLLIACFIIVNNTKETWRYCAVLQAPLYLRHDGNHGTLLQLRDLWHCYFVTGPSGCSNKGVFEVSSASRRGICQDGTWELVNPNTVTSDELYGVRVRRCFFIIGASCWSVLESMSDLCLDEGAP